MKKPAKKTASRKSAARKTAAPISKIQINLNGKFDWKTEKEISALNKKGASINITARSINAVSKSLLNELQKKSKAQPEANKRVSGTTKRIEPARTKEIYSSATNKFTEKRIIAPPIKYNETALEKLRQQVRRKGKGNPFFKKEYYEKLLKKINKNKKEGIDLETTLLNLKKRNKNIKTITIQTDKNTFHYNVHNITDRLKKDEAKNTKVQIKDFEGKVHEFSNMEKALVLLRDLNNKINETIDIAGLNKDGTKTAIYVTIPQTITDTNSGKETTSLIAFDFANLNVQNFDKAEFNYYLNATNEDSEDYEDED